jgi:AhpD family alkylhydroperoxidase
MSGGRVERRGATLGGMDTRDPFPRRTATPAALAPWVAELARTLPGLLASYDPRGPLDARTRERVILAVTEVNGCRYCAWIHGSWQEFLGAADGPTAEDALLTYARACADAGRPLDTAPLAAHLPPAAVQAVRATVAQIEVSNLVGNTVDGLLARLTRKRPLSPLAAAREAITIGAALPLAVPLLGLAGAMRAVERVAPALPEPTMPPAGEANLLVHLLAQAVPAWLSNAALRLAVLGLPVTVSVGVRAGRTEATASVGRGRITLANGVAPHVVAVIEGEVEPLLRLASGAVLEELGHIRVRRQ